MNGTNLTNEFSQSPDFEIGTQKEAIENYLFPYRNANGLQTDQDSPLFDETVVQKISELLEIDKNSLNIVYGCYASYDYSEDYIQPIENMVYENDTPNNAMTIQVLDDQSIDLLGNYIKKNKLDIDIESLIDGNGILVLHIKEWRVLSVVTIILCVCIPQIMYMKNGLRSRWKYQG